MGINWQYYHWHLEPSAVCALRCPRCPRTEHPDTPWLNYNMDLEFVKSFLTPDLLRNEVRRITMCGDVGDPIYCPEYLDIYEYIKSIDPTIHIFTITNGSNKKIKWWERFAELANEYDSINFSIDGFDNDSNNIYRVNSRWDSIMDGIRTMRLNNDQVFLNWATIVFKFNEAHLHNIKYQAMKLGMDRLQLTKSTKFGSKYGEAYNAEDDELEPSSKWISKTHRYEREIWDLSGRAQPNTDYLEYNRQKFIEVKQKYEDSYVVPMCEIGNRGLYVNAEGVLFPCSWTSFPYTSLATEHKTINWEDSFFAKYRKDMNLRYYSLNEITADPKWNYCSTSWKDSESAWVECAQKCHNSLVDEEYAVGWETN